ncbi:MAG TPA: nitroreductase family deazaflavin-dependent oxidoreductase [Actinomycetes bacterium]
MTIDARLARLNKHVLNRVIGTIAGRPLSPVAFMVHQGRRSGREYRTPVMPLPLSDGFLVSLPYGPNRDWVRNVFAAGRCTLLRGGRRHELTDPRMLDAAGAAPLLPAALRPALRVVPGIRFVRLSRRL